jgi:NodT family efflux transporter outer membrane factor (OMF) lipoprotein
VLENPVIDKPGRQSPPLRRRTGLGLTALLALSLAGCAGLPAEQSPADLLSRDALGLADTAASAPLIAPDWWRQFGDPVLDQLVSQALLANPSLKVVQARLQRAQSGVELADSARGPQLNASLDLMRQRFTATGLYPPPLAGSNQNTGTLQLNGSWEIDFFGKNRAALDAALGMAQAAAADAQAARELLATNVARTYLQLARLNDQLGVARRTLAQRDEALGLVRDRLRAGLDTRLELSQSEGGLPEARQQIEALQEQLALTQHTLAALLARPNEQVVAVQPSLASIRPVLAASTIPADLLGRRADIAAARWRVEAALQDKASARAQFYPNVNLLAFAGLSSIGLDRLLQSNSQQWGVGPAVRLPIFDGGRLRANLRGKNAELDAAIESYNGAVIDAVHEVADQLASGQSIVRQRLEQTLAQQSAETAYEIAVQRYKAGLGNYLNVLSAETTVLAQRRLGVDLAARALDTQLALIHALGGGYRPSTGDTSSSTRPSAEKAS